MLDQQAVLLSSLSNAILVATKMMGGNQDLSRYVDQIISIAPLLDDKRFQDVVDGYKDDMIGSNYTSVTVATEPYIKRYWSNVYFKILVAEFANSADGLQFETNTNWNVKLYYNNSVVAISYFDPVTREYMTGDIFELDLQHALREVVERIEWVAYGHHPRVFPVKTKHNTFSRLKEVKQ